MAIEQFKDKLIKIYSIKKKLKPDLDKYFAENEIVNNQENIEILTNFILSKMEDLNNVE